MVFIPGIVLYQSTLVSTCLNKLKYVKTLFHEIPMMWFACHPQYSKTLGEEELKNEEQISYDEKYCISPYFSH